MFPRTARPALPAGLLICLLASLPGAAAELAPEPCSRFGLPDAPEEVTCGYVSVPQRHARPDGPTMELAVVVIPGASPDAEPDPLFVAQGGPGGSTIDAFAALLLSDPAYRPAQNRDIVLWDQRGTLYSRPFLACPEVARADLDSVLADREVDSAAVDAAYAACGARLGEEVGDLSAFNSVENANDVEAIRQALGYETINFYGVSYGTELGQYVLRQHAGRVRSMILDAVVPLDFSLITDVPFVQQRIGEKYFGSCAADPWCGEAFPDLGPRFLALLDRLDDMPVTVEVRNPLDPVDTRYPVRLDGVLLGGALYQSLYMPEMHPLIPYLVDRADAGDFDFVSQVLLPLVLFDETHATGMYIAVVCAGGGSLPGGMPSYDGLAARLADGAEESVAATQALCRKWGIEPLPEAVHEPVASAVPTLLLSGDFDPITPPAFAAAVGADLEADFEVTFPSGSHGQAFGSDCANTIIQRFLDAPGTWPGAACANAAPEDYITPTDLLRVPGLAAAVGQAEAGATDQLLAAARPALWQLLILWTAIPIYVLGGLWSLLRRQRGAAGDPGRSRLARWAPFLAVVCAVSLTGYLVAFARALWDTAAWQPVVVYLGALYAGHGWIAWVAYLGVVATLILIAAVFARWRHREGGLPGRLYLTVLAMAAVGLVASLWRLELLPPFLAG